MNRTVHFNDNTTVHHMIVWQYAYRAARVSPWETLARDRARFIRRINQMESIIGPILLRKK
jgi:protein phosphatase 1 regulatory subunit 15B